MTRNRVHEIVEVKCIYCHGSGRSTQFIGYDALGREIRLPCDCLHCEGQGVKRVKHPSRTWPEKAAEAQKLAHHALYGRK